MSTRADQIFAHFEKFHRANPHVWGLFQRFTLDIIRSGRKNYSAYMIFHRIRWHTDIETRSETGLRICNNHIPYYARMFHVKYPEFDGFFTSKKLTTKDKPAMRPDRQVFGMQAPENEEALTAKLTELAKLETKR